MKIKNAEIDFWDLVFVFMFWVFLDLRIIDQVYRFKGSYNILSIFIVCLFVFLLRKRGIYFSVLPKLDNLRHLIGYIFICGVILIPLGLWLGFLQYNFQFWRLLISPVVLVGIYFTIGLIEELVFRQFLFGWALGKFGYVPALILNSIIFGLFHINNGGFPNWNYVLLAAIAGLFYALVFKKFGLGEAILLHSVVDLTMFIFFK